MKERIAIIDFGARYNQLIAEAVLNCGVYAELLPPDASVERIKGDCLSGLILSGCYDSVYAPGSRNCTDGIFSLGVPILGICYGMQLISHKLGGKVEPAPVKEFGRTFVRFDRDRLFEGIPDSVMWMYHNDWVGSIPEGFNIIAETDGCPHGAISCETRGIYAVQFHPEVKHSEYGQKLFENFVLGICGCKGGMTFEMLADELASGIADRVGPHRIAAPLSCGIDSITAAALAKRAVGDRLICLFIDHGLYRENEPAELMALFSDAGLNTVYVDACQSFSNKLNGACSIKQKRERFSEEYARILQNEASKLGAEFLLQATCMHDMFDEPDASVILKTPNNANGIEPDSTFKGILEPLNGRIRHETLSLAKALGLPAKLISRMPLPPAGMAELFCGALDANSLQTLRKAEHIISEELANNGVFDMISRCYASLIEHRGTAGLSCHTLVLRAVKHTEEMTVECVELPFKLLTELGLKLKRALPEVSRVVYDFTPDKI